MAVRFAVALPENCNESLSTNHLAASKQDGGCPSIGHVAVCVPVMKSVDRENCYRSQQGSSTMYFCEHGLRAGWTMDGKRKEMTKVHHTMVCVTDCHPKLCGFCGLLDVSSRKNHFPLPLATLLVPCQPRHHHSPILTTTQTKKNGADISWKFLQFFFFFVLERISSTITK